MESTGRERTKSGMSSDFAMAATFRGGRLSESWRAVDTHRHANTLQCHMMSHDATRHHTSSINSPHASRKALVPCRHVLSGSLLQLTVAQRLLYKLHVRKGQMDHFHTNCANQMTSIWLLSSPLLVTSTRLSPPLVLTKHNQFPLTLLYAYLAAKPILHIS